MLEKKDVQKIASLAKLTLTPDEVSKYQNELDKILGYMEKLNELDLEGVTATSHAVATHNVFRPDVQVTSHIQEDVWGQAPEVHDHFFQVPRVI